MNSHYQNYDKYEEDVGTDDEEENNSFNFAPNDSYYPSYHEDEPKSSKKKRKTEPLASNYEFAPRGVPDLSKSSNLGGNSRESWNEEESFVLLEVWGERYLELGRRSLRAEDWVEVSEKVSEMIGGVKSEAGCRNQMDVLKKKFKKERAKLEKFGGGFVSKWVFFKKMDVLLNLRMRGHCGLGCGVDSGEYVFMNPRLYLDKSNVLDEMRDSPGQSEDENDDDDDGLGGEEVEDNGECARVLAESIQRFGEIYEKVESNKRKQILDLERMRRDLQRDLESQKKQIFERAQADIAKIREREEEEDERSEREQAEIAKIREREDEEDERGERAQADIAEIREREDEEDEGSERAQADIAEIREREDEEDEGSERAQADIAEIRDREDEEDEGSERAQADIAEIREREDEEDEVSEEDGDDHDEEDDAPAENLQE